MIVQEAHVGTTRDVTWEYRSNCTNTGSDYFGSCSYTSIFLDVFFLMVVFHDQYDQYDQYGQYNQYNQYN